VIVSCLLRRLEHWVLLMAWTGYRFLFSLADYFYSYARYCCDGIQCHYAFALNITDVSAHVRGQEA